MAKDKRRTILDEWLDLMETRRRALLMELHALETFLIRHGRLKRRSVPKDKR